MINAYVTPLMAKTTKVTFFFHQLTNMNKVSVLPSYKLTDELWCVLVYN